MDDLISRSALHSIVCLDSSRGTYGEFTDGSEVSFTSNEVHAIIDEAPAVNAETYLEQLELVKEAFDMAKSNLAPVIRCKDCYYWMKAKVNRSGNLVCPKSGMEIVATDYCSRAERRKCK